MGVQEAKSREGRSPVEVITGALEVKLFTQAQLLKLSGLIVSAFFLSCFYSVCFMRFFT